MRYCIGDVHGCLQTLKKLIEQIFQDDQNPELYFIGDLIDRGPDSKGIIDYIIKLKQDRIRVNGVRGNHEQMFLDAYSKNLPIYTTNWYYNGAESTIASFSKTHNLNNGIKNYIPQYYYDFINRLPYFIELENFLIVHAGFNFRSSKPFEELDSMLWTRFEQNDHSYTNGKKIIHGHTPITKKEIKERIVNNNSDVINIDSGCVYVKKTLLGFLTALNLDNMNLIHVKNIDIIA